MELLKLAKRNIWFLLLWKKSWQAMCVDYHLKELFNFGNSVAYKGISKCDLFLSMMISCPTAADEELLQQIEELLERVVPLTTSKKDC
jgi:hypothetical protein